MVLFYSYFTIKYQFLFSRQITKKMKNFQDQEIEHDPEHHRVHVEKRRNTGQEVERSSCTLQT